MILGLLCGLARAELPPPDYRDAIMAAAADEVSSLARDQGPEAAEDLAKRWSRTVGSDARIEYELGLAWRLGGDAGKAKRHLDRALALDPKNVPALYDRGEVLLNEGDLDDAQADFEAVVKLAPDRWAGHFRLADIAARRRQPEAFEAHLLGALRQGFSLRTVVGDPRWHGYLRDPDLGPVLRSLAVVYQDEAVLDALEAAPPEPSK